VGTQNTNLVINAKTKGYAEAQRQTATLIGGTEKSLKGLVTKQSELTKSLSSMGDKGSKAYKAIAKELRAVDKEAGQVERTLKRLDRAFDRQDRKERQRTQEAEKRSRASAKQGAFGQGFLQGAAPSTATFLQRGPGMRRQAMGMAAGAGARRLGQGAMSVAGSPFTGAQGLAQGLMSIPGGGLVAAPMLAAMGQASKALSYKQAQQQALPFLGGMSAVQSMAGAGTRAGRRFDSKKSYGSELDQRMSVFQAQGMSESEAYGEATMSSIGEDDMMSRRGGLKKERAQAVGRARAKARTREMAGIQATGLKFGYTPQEAMQMTSQVSQAGGGTCIAMREQGMAGTAMAAQRLLSVGSDVSGAFLQGGRTGGVVGGQGRSSDAMAEAIGEAVNLKLSGSDLTEFMQQMAGDIRSWRNTGIPLNSATIGAMGQTFSKLGVGGVRGAKMGKGLADAAKGIANQGIRSAEDFAALQELGGYKGGGAEEYEKARLRMESGDFVKGGEQNLMKRFSKMGGAKGRLQLKRSMGKLGVTMGVKETIDIDKQLRSGKPISTQESTLTAEKLAGLGADAVDPALKKQAATEAKQVSVGQQMLGAVQAFESSTAKVSKAFSTLAEDPLKRFSKAVEDAAGALETISKIPNTAKAIKDTLGTAYKIGTGVIDPAGLLF